MKKLHTVITKKRVQQWGVEDVKDWIKYLRIEKDYEEYAQLFEEHSIDGGALLSMDPDQIKEIGIANDEHIKTIHQRILQFHQTEESAVVNDSHPRPYSIQKLCQFIKEDIFSFTLFTNDELLKLASADSCQLALLLTRTVDEVETYQECLMEEIRSRILRDFLQKQRNTIS